jgi:hypothetical protein
MSPRTKRAAAFGAILGLATWAVFIFAVAMTSAALSATVTGRFNVFLVDIKNGLVGGLLVAIVIGALSAALAWLTSPADRRS